MLANYDFMFCVFFLFARFTSQTNRILLCAVFFRFVLFLLLTAASIPFPNPLDVVVVVFFPSCIDAEVCRLEPLTEHKPLHFESTKTDVNQWVRHMLVQTDCKNVIRWSQMSQGTLLAHFVGCWVGYVFFRLFLLILFLNKKWLFLTMSEYVMWVIRRNVGKMKKISGLQFRCCCFQTKTK